ncbi:M91 family zinc metallopeptidase [Acaricomes phytoseiuli]|uniref:M91 family zinc metallopeptidase n=1 Tax=Acaricomes phytoseiuli TaxID=291968 RepID=UPI00222213AC|nr:M91 family zinc metallopeptidase [Acaricomes phytoseiuli]MCW1250642.1 M91 family zinc metallopeptidase [Acaricomes phytoseiuli]
MPEGSGPELRGVRVVMDGSDTGIVIGLDRFAPAAESQAGGRLTERKLVRFDGDGGGGRESADAFVERMRGLLEELGQSRQGQRLLRGISGMRPLTQVGMPLDTGYRDVTVVIHRGVDLTEKGAAAYPFNVQDSKNFQGSVAGITVSDESSVLTGMNIEDRSRFVLTEKAILAHELIHTSHYLQGNVPTGDRYVVPVEVKYERSNGAKEKNPVYIKAEEVRTVGGQDHVIYNTAINKMNGKSGIEDPAAVGSKQAAEKLITEATKAGNYEKATNLQRVMNARTITFGVTETSLMEEWGLNPRRHYSNFSEIRGQPAEVIARRMGVGVDDVEYRLRALPEGVAKITDDQARNPQEVEKILTRRGSKNSWKLPSCVRGSLIACIPNSSESEVSQQTWDRVKDVENFLKNNPDAEIIGNAPREDVIHNRASKTAQEFLKSPENKALLEEGKNPKTWESKDSARKYNQKIKQRLISGFSASNALFAVDIADWSRNMYLMATDPSRDPADLENVAQALSLIPGLSQGIGIVDGINKSDPQIILENVVALAIITASVFFPAFGVAAGVGSLAQRIAEAIAWWWQLPEPIGPDFSGLVDRPSPVKIAAGGEGRVNWVVANIGREVWSDFKGEMKFTAPEGMRFVEQEAVPSTYSIDGGQSWQDDPGLQGCRREDGEKTLICRGTGKRSNYWQGSLGNERGNSKNEGTLRFQPLVRVDDNASIGLVTGSGHLSSNHPSSVAQDGWWNPAIGTRIASDQENEYDTTIARAGLYVEVTIRNGFFGSTDSSDVSKIPAGGQGRLLWGVGNDGREVWSYGYQGQMKFVAPEYSRFVDQETVPVSFNGSKMPIVNKSPMRGCRTYDNGKELVCQTPGDWDNYWPGAIGNISSANAWTQYREMYPLVQVDSDAPVGQRSKGEGVLSLNSAYQAQDGGWNDLGKINVKSSLRLEFTAAETVSITGLVDRSPVAKISAGKQGNVWFTVSNTGFEIHSQKDGRMVFRAPEYSQFVDQESVNTLYSLDAGNTWAEESARLRDCRVEEDGKILSCSSPASSRGPWWQGSLGNPQGNSKREEARAFSPVVKVNRDAPAGKKFEGNVAWDIGPKREVLQAKTGNWHEIGDPKFTGKLNIEVTQSDYPGVGSIYEPTAISAGGQGRVNWGVSNAGSEIYADSVGTIRFRAPHRSRFPDQAIVPTASSLDRGKTWTNSQLRNCRVEDAGKTLTCQDPGSWDHYWQGSLGNPQGNSKREEIRWIGPILQVDQDAPEGMVLTGGQGVMPLNNAQQANPGTWWSPWKHLGNINITGTLNIRVKRAP